jgi:phosphatidylinositol alpha-1,6-mannosyltransferase
MASRIINGADREGFGVVYLEASRRGKPIVAPNVGGCVEAIINGETGILVDPQSPHEIALAIIKLLKDKDLAHKLGEQGRVRVEKEFLASQQVEKIRKLINK